MHIIKDAYKKTAIELTTPSGAYTLQPHHHKVCWLTQKLWTTYSFRPHLVHK